ncbi:hypothetical protein [Nitrosomonas sp. ANs5]|uniref:hypothetical protein n=1 Tax=Nitrosomonas sp. ANs5 TaxID=3423941 RepID=UPI003D3586A3
MSSVEPYDGSTARKKFGAGLKAFDEWASKARHKLTKGEMLRRASARVAGHLNYYAITDNATRCSNFVYRAAHILYKRLNRKSQRKAYNWDRFNQALNSIGWPRVRIPHRPESMSKGGGLLND